MEKHQRRETYCQGFRKARCWGPCCLYFTSTTCPVSSPTQGVESSFLEHCSPIWAPNHLGLLNDLEAAQKRCIKWVLGASPCESWSDSYYYDKLVMLRILPIREQFYFNDMKLVYKIFNDLAPFGLPQYFTIVLPTDYAYRSRFNKDIVDGVDISTLKCIINPKTSTFRHGFYYRSVQNWNSIPYKIRQSSSYDCFCLRLKNYMFESLTVCE